MGHYALILEKRYQEFRDLYRRKGSLCKIRPEEYGDLLPGNYVRSLLALGEYEEAIQICQHEIQLETEETARRGYNSSSSVFLIWLGTAYMKLGRYEEAAQAIRESPHAAYQPNRIQAPCLMYYIAVAMGDEKLKRESIKILNARLRAKAGTEPAFAPARFLRDKISEDQLLQETATITHPKLYMRALVSAGFLIAVKRFEKGDIDGCCQQLKETCSLYEKDQIAAMPFEYFLAESWLTELNKKAGGSNIC